MKELIERLRYPVLCTLDDRLEAADALERLTAELEATKKAVQQNYFRVVEVTAERDALVAENEALKRTDVLDLLQENQELRRQLEALARTVMSLKRPKAS